MSRKSMILACACLAAGTLLGHATAAGKLNLLQKVTGATPPAPKEGACCCPAGTDRPQFIAAQDDRQSSTSVGGPHLGAIRIGDFKYPFYQQPEGWPGPKVATAMPTIINLRQDPFERTPSIGKQSLNNLGGGYMNDFYAREFWRFVFVQQRVADLARTAIDYSPTQDPASFNLEAIKKKIEDMIKTQRGQ